MHRRLDEFIATERLLTRRHRLLLAVSGGVDSVVMIFLLHKLGYKISVAHVNFGLRDSESDADEKFVRQLCKKLGADLFVKQVGTKDFATKQKMGIQEAARKLRYDWFWELVEEYKFDRMLTAHHATDSLETILLNLTRGTGLKGLEGIKPKNGKLVRPMLCFAAHEIRDFAKKEKLEWREDSSNASDKYKRNFIRHKVIPLLLEVNPNLEQTIQSHQGLMAEVNRVVDEKVQIFITDKVKSAKDTISIITQEINDFDYPLNLIKELTSKFGFSHATHKAILLSCKRKSSKKFFSDTHELRTGSSLLISPIQVFKKTVIAVDSFPQKCETDDSVFDFRIVKPKHKPVFGKEADYLDAAKLSLPLRLRNWQKGDRFKPSGMKGSKLLSDFLTDLKLSPREKNKVLVLENDEEIACVVGMRVSEKYKVTELTNKILKIKQKQKPI